MPDVTEQRIFRVSTDDSGDRLDRCLAAHVDGLSRARAQALIRDGHVEVADRPVDDANYRVKAGEEIRVGLPPRPPPAAPAESMDLVIPYEDDHLLVIDKPAGLVVHPAPGHALGTLVGALLAHCGASLSHAGGLNRPGIVHRLDKDTSGLLVVAKTEAAHHGLSEQFAAHGADGRLHRSYVALCWGAPSRPAGMVETRIGRSPVNRKKMAVLEGVAGRKAVTRYAVVETFPGDAKSAKIASLVRLELLTGRTHQIRVHMAHRGHPVMGDSLYGAGFKTRAARLHPAAREALDRLGRQALHAAELGFEHPVTGAPLRFTSPLPDDIARLLKALRDDAPDKR